MSVLELVIGNDLLFSAMRACLLSVLAIGDLIGRMYVTKATEGRSKVFVLGQNGNSINHANCCFR